MAKPVAVRLDPRMAYADAAAAVVRVRAGELFARVDDALDTRDIEAVHDMRVATRRLRAVLEIFAPCFPRKHHRAVLRDVKRLADALGERRDPDVRIEEIEALSKRLSVNGDAGVGELLERLRIDQAVGNARLAVAIDEARRTDLVGRLLDLAERAR